MKLYLDTSIFGGFFDEEFEEDTELLFDYITQYNIQIVYSEVLEKELKNAPDRVRRLLESIPNRLYVTLNESTIALANTYIKEGVLGEKSVEDAYHIAMATTSRTSEIVSWNFKHMVDFLKTRQYNIINLREGYGLINIHSPLDIVRIIEAQNTNNHGY